MAIKDILKIHHTWEEGVGLLLGLTVGLSPWFYNEPAVPAVLLNSGFTGLALLALAQLELVRLRRWEEIAQLACGLWLSASPFIFGRTGMGRTSRGVVASVSRSRERNSGISPMSIAWPCLTAISGTPLRSDQSASVFSSASSGSDHPDASVSR